MDMLKIGRSISLGTLILSFCIFVIGVVGTIHNPGIWHHGDNRYIAFWFFILVVINVLVEKELAEKLEHRNKKGGLNG